MRAEDADIRDQANALVTANADNEKMLTQLEADYADRILDRAAFVKQSSRLKERVETRSGELSALRGQSALDRLGGDVAANWSTMSADDKRLIILALIESIEVNKPARRGGNVFDVQRLNIRWRPAIVAGRNQYLGLHKGKAALLQWGVSKPVPANDGNPLKSAT